MFNLHDNDAWISKTAGEQMAEDCETISHGMHMCMGVSAAMGDV